jgi:hypothetical protein
MEFILITDVENMEEKYIFKYRRSSPIFADNLKLNNKIDVIFIYTDS